MTDYKLCAMIMLSAGFERNQRADGEAYYVFNTTRDVSAQDLHGTDMFPDDWRFNTLDTIATELAQRASDTWEDSIYEVCDGCVDVYTHKLLAFMASHSSRKHGADEAISEGISVGIDDAIRIAQHNEALMLANALIEAAGEIADELETESEAA